ncbi:prenylcysteine oxidase [Zalerion maritima]|uniref:Prenylcysteine oxidase n=1 Tax=Zalerion maritima TaxID=339359 RepID=A0AAD5RS06_9PEZI|nr:prenylcysteine oxidase [Zalerion maritima]
MFGQLAGIAAALGASLGLSPTSPQDQVHQVAIIGAGPAGSSAAYHIHKYAEEAGVEVNITLFEKEDRIGGRTLTVPAYGDGEPVELGASIFIEMNHIMYNATQEFGLTPTAPGSGDDDAGGALGIWDGGQFVFTMDEGSSRWWNLAKLFWKYGMAPYKTQKVMESTVGSFLQMYSRPHFPFKSLTEVAMNLGLTEITGSTGEQFLKSHSIGDAYAHDIVQASTRVNYASNIGYIHGLEAMVAMAPEGALQIDGGNWQIFDRMVKKSGANVYLGSAVSSVDRHTKDTKSTFSLKQKGEEGDETYDVTFDDVVIATPFQYSGIQLANEGETMEETIDEIPYADLRVTLFTSPLRLDPIFFGMPVGSEAPTTILTTLAKDDEQAVFPKGAGKAGFYSISTLRNTTNPKTQQEEFIYKIFSPAEVTAEFLSKLLGTKIPDSFTGINPEDPDTEPISWYYPHKFHAYPIAYPRVTFQEPVLAPGLYYTSGMESFISTMETNALSGMNIAKLIVDEVVASMPKKTEEEKAKEGEQKVLSNEIDRNSEL